MVVGVAVGLFFILLGTSFILGKRTDIFKILSLTPVIWLIIRLIMRFTRTISYLRVSDITLEMLSLIFLILFFMAFAQVNSNVEAKGNEWKTVGFGFPAVLLALNLFIPRAILVLSGNAGLMHILSRADVSDLALSIFIIAAVLTRIAPNISNIVARTSIITDDNTTDETAE